MTLTVMSGHLPLMSDLIFHSYLRKSQHKSNLPLKPGILPVKRAVYEKMKQKTDCQQSTDCEVQIPWRYNLLDM